jgi:hypothetical protein
MLLKKKVALPFLPFLPFLLFILILTSCTTAKKATVTQQKANITGLKFLGEFNVPFALNYKNTTIGGLSGIDFDVLNNNYYLICDDRSNVNPARLYKANISITKKGIDTMYFTDMIYLLQSNDSTYPNYKKDRSNTPDPEAIRYNPVTRQLTWSSEGERIVKEKDTVLSDPAIRIINTNGKFADSFPIPNNLRMHSVEKGPRQNSVFEGLSYSDNYKTLFISVEEPCFEDGPRASISENNAYIRILKIDILSKINTAQYAYKIDPVAHSPEPATAFSINGVSEILSIGNEKLLVVERSFSTGRQACTIKVFLTDLKDATDIKNNTSLIENKVFKTAKKTLLLNMDDLGIYIDNIEGITFGPDLPNGQKTLLFVADNNFNPLQKSQLLLFEVIE